MKEFRLLGKRKLLTLLTLLFFILTVPAFSQKKSSKKSSGGSFPYKWGIGVKLGDPTGISIKKYNGDKAIEFIAGRGYYWGYYDYNYYFNHRHKFYGYHINYVNDFSYPIVFQLRYLKHKAIEGIPGLRWYIGAGAQLRFSNYYYSYWNADYSVYYNDVRYTDIGIGADGIIGMEYTFEDIPLTLGLDVNLYMEIIDQPFLLLGQGGLAIRYNF
jgi:hypothetical protein